MMAECTKSVEIKVETEVKNLKDELRTVKSEVTRNTNNIAALKEDLDLHKSNCEGGDTSRRLLRQTDQKLLDSDIILKGFIDDSADIDEIKQNLSAICNIQQGFSNSYKFSRTIGLDKKTKKPIDIHMMSLSFVSKLDKEKVLTKIRDEGHLLLGDLLTQCPSDAKTNQVWIDHKLTRENLALKKRLLQLKREKLIDGFSMRSGLFVAKQKDATGRPLSFTASELSELLKQFPESTKNTKRHRSENSSSPSTPNPDGKFAKVVNNKQATSSRHGNLLK